MNAGATIADTLGLRFDGKQQSGFIDLPPEFAALVPETWAFTDRSIGFTFYVPVNSTLSSVAGRRAEKRAEFDSAHNQR